MNMIIIVIVNIVYKSLKSKPRVGHGQKFLEWQKYKPDIFVVHKVSGFSHRPCEVGRLFVRSLSFAQFQLLSLFDEP